MDIKIELAGLDVLAGAINNLAAALAAGNALEKAAAPKKPPAAKPAPAAEAIPPGKPEQGSGQTAAVESTAPVSEIPTAASPSKQQGATVAEVRAAIAALSKTDKARCLQILESVGAKSVSMIKEEDYEKVLEATK